MIRLWIGTALLAGSWLLGLDYFYPASPWAWLAAVVAAVVLLGDTDSVAVSLGERRSWRLDAASLALLLPAVWFAPWPYRAAPLLMVLGLALQLLPIRKRWSDRLACGAVAAGVVLLVQALALELYASHTAWSHELPWPLPDLLGGIAGLLGIDAAADGSSVVMHSMRQVHRLAATWELLLDPATLLFFVGGLTMLALACGPACGMRRGILHSAFSLRLALRSAASRALVAHRARLAAVAGRAADGPLLAPRVAFRSRSAAARDEPFFLALDAVVAADRAGAVGVAIRAAEGRGTRDEGRGQRRLICSPGTNRRLVGRADDRAILVSSLIPRPFASSPRS